MTEKTEKLLMKNRRKRIRPIASFAKVLMIKKKNVKPESKKIKRPLRDFWDPLKEPLTT